ncbi:unnamed protein product [Trichogramma brassicae]|uniref:Uncharacterized protein n=1 Tax=Trichogramma brassicae TaxID=86971 RepID=A0A6H5IJ99_9HYME|nr:unnamed protein product [Trichogramma brassicae]
MAARRHRRPRTKSVVRSGTQRLVMILGDRCCKSEKKAELEPAAVVLTADMVRDRVRSRPRKGAIELQSTTSAEQDPAAQVCAKAPIVQGELPSVPSTSTTEATPAAVASVSQDKIQLKEIAAVPSTSSADVIIVSVKKAPISDKPVCDGPRAAEKQILGDARPRADRRLAQYSVRQFAPSAAASWSNLEYYLNGKGRDNASTVESPRHRVIILERLHSASASVV